MESVQDLIGEEKERQQICDAQTDEEHLPGSKRRSNLHRATHL